MKILGIDLGKYKSVACLFDTEANSTLFFTFYTRPDEFKKPDLVVIKACAVTGWSHDLCVEQEFKVLVANPSQEAWNWKHVKRKTDQDDALKLAKLAALGQIVPVYVPSPESRQYRQISQAVGRAGDAHTKPDSGTACPSRGCHSQWQ